MPSASGRSGIGTGTAARTLQERVGNLEYGYRISADGEHVEAEPNEQAALVQNPKSAPARALIASNTRRAERASAADAGGTGWRQDPDTPHSFDLAHRVVRFTGRQHNIEYGSLGGHIKAVALPGLPLLFCATFAVVSVSAPPHQHQVFSPRFLTMAH
jgi:hypothetical protein